MVIPGYLSLLNNLTVIPVSRFHRAQDRRGRMRSRAYLSLECLWCTYFLLALDIGSSWTSEFCNTRAQVYAECWPVYLRFNSISQVSYRSAYPLIQQSLRGWLRLPVSGSSLFVLKTNSIRLPTIPFWIELAKFSSLRESLTCYAIVVGKTSLRAVCTDDHLNNQP